MGGEAGKNPSVSGAPSGEEVQAFLREHSDFLVRHPDLIAHLLPPAVDRGEGVVDFQYFLVERLRGEVRRLKDAQRELVATSRANLNNQARVHAATLSLLDARSLEHLIDIITTDLVVLLDLDVICLLVEGNGREGPRVGNGGIRVVEPGLVRRRLGRRDVVLLGDVPEDPEIFGGAAGLVRSEALVRLHVSTEAPEGLLAFGSRDPAMFHQGQATELATFLARVVERTIRSWLALPS